MNEKPRRRWRVFRLRTLFVLVAAVSIPLAWVAYSLNWIRERRLVEARHTPNRIAPTPNPKPAPIWPPGLLWMFGEPGIYALAWNPTSPESLDRLRRLFPESRIRVYSDAKERQLERELAPMAAGEQ